MNIRMKILSAGKSVKGADGRIWLVRKSDGAEFIVGSDSSNDEGVLGAHPDLVDNLPCNSQYFSRIKYTVEKKGYRKAEGVTDVVDGDINLGDIELEREALRVSGRVTSNKRPVAGAKIIVLINGVERARIETSHEGTFDREIEGIYEGQTLDWTVKRLGYWNKSETVEIRSNRINLETIDLTPRWWIRICQRLGIAPEVLAGVLLTLALGAVVVWWALGCPEASVKAENFTKEKVSGDDIQGVFSECRYRSQGKCGTELDGEITGCMTERGYLTTK